MATPANYVTLIAEIDAIVDDFALSIFQVFGGKPSNLVSLMQLIDLRYKLFEAGGGSGGAIATSTTSTNVASSATSVSLLAANSDRKFASFRNDSTAIAYIELGATATTSSAYRLDPQGFLSLDNYTGAISCIWASANGFMRVSEGV